MWSMRAGALLLACALLTSWGCQKKRQTPPPAPTVSGTRPAAERPADITADTAPVAASAPPLREPEPPASQIASQPATDDSFDTGEALDTAAEKTEQALRTAGRAVGKGLEAAGRALEWAGEALKEESESQPTTRSASPP